MKYVLLIDGDERALATSVRVREARRLVTDGPFAETRERLGGYFVIDAGMSTQRSASVEAP